MGEQTRAVQFHLWLQRKTAGKLWRNGKLEEPADSTLVDGLFHDFQYVISKSQNILKAQNNFQKILIVEDNLINQKVLKMLLGDQNLELEFAQNGQKAVELFQSDKFDLILMDTQMPIMDGLEATKIIRKIESDSKISRTPIINLSANVMHEQIMEIMQAGADDYIAKPIAANELFEKIDHWLNVA